MKQNSVHTAADRSSLPALKPDRAPSPSGASIDSVDAVALWLGLTTLAAAGLLWMSRFQPALAIALGSAATIAVIAIATVGVRWPRPRVDALGALTVVAWLVFRVDRYPHLQGGQDQGLYTNMAIALRRSGSINFEDRFRPELSGKLLEVYDRFRPAGVSLVDAARSIDTIDFYPGHPLWMAMFGAVFGDSRQTLSLLFFSGVGILFAMGIAGELLPGSRAPGIAGLLMAVNPALAFFAKFPVTEIVAGAFSLAGFLELLRACNTSISSRARFVHGVAAVAAFGSLCFVRFQLLLYLPFFALLVLSLTRYFSPTIRRALVGVIVPSMLLMQVSFLFYRHEQPLLYEGVIEKFVNPTVHASTLIAAFVGISAVVVTVYTVLVMRGRWNVVNRCVDRVLRHAGLVLVVALLASIPSIVELYRTGNMTPWEYQVETANDIWIVRYHSIWRLLLMLSPIGFVSLFAFVGWRNMPRRVAAALVLLASCWCAVILIQPYVPYLYYYGRYLIADILPLALILCAVLAAHLIRIRHTVVAVAMVSLIVLWSVPFSWMQVGHIESESVGMAAHLASLMDDEDVAVFTDGDNLVMLPLRVAFDRNTIVIRPGTTYVEGVDTDEIQSLLQADLYQRTIERGANVYFASRTPLNAVGLVPVMSDRFETSWVTNSEHTRDGTFQTSAERRLLLPSIQRSMEWPWYVYRVAENYFDAIDCDGSIDLSNPVSGTLAANGFYPSQDGSGRWTSTEAAIGCLIRDGVRPTSLTVNVSSAFVTPTHPQRIDISIDGVHVGSSTLSVDHLTDSLTFAVPPGSTDHVIVEISAPDATSPVATGQGADANIYGVDIHDVTYTK